MRLIDADMLFRFAQNCKYKTVDCNDIMRMPTVDAVRIVRCRDCKHYWKYNNSEQEPVCLVSPRDDAFCSEGKPREQNHEIDRC